MSSSPMSSRRTSRTTSGERGICLPCRVSVSGRFGCGWHPCPRVVQLIDPSDCPPRCFRRYPQQAQEQGVPPAALVSSMPPEEAKPSTSGDGRTQQPQQQLTPSGKRVREGTPQGADGQPPAGEEVTPSKRLKAEDTTEWTGLDPLADSDPMQPKPEPPAASS